MNKPMELHVDLDWCTLKCPCGAEYCNRYADDMTEWLSFEAEHKPHTNGQLLEIVTDNGAKVLTKKPAPRLIEY